MITSHLFLADRHLTATADTIEAALGMLQKQLSDEEGRPVALTYRPSDRTIYRQSHIPCGISVDS